MKLTKATLDEYFDIIADGNYQGYVNEIREYINFLEKKAKKSLYRKDTISIDETPARIIALNVIVLLNEEGFLSDKQVKNNSYFKMEDILTEMINKKIKELEK